MTVENEAFIDLEQLLHTQVDVLWRKKWKELQKQMNKLVNEEKWDAAIAIANNINFDDVIAETQGLARTLAEAALFLGASRIDDPANASFFGEPDERLIENAVLQWSIVLERNASIALQTTAEIQLADMERVRQEKKLNAIVKMGSLIIVNRDVIYKADPDLSRVGRQGTQFSRAAAALMISRMSTAGFMLEAQAQGIKVYRVTEVLDGLTCPICTLMHNKTYPVAAGLALSGAIMNATDPESLKGIAPWPSQGAANVKRLSGMSQGQLISGGHNLPPYHPNCYSDETLVYTRRGFIPFADVDINTDRFLTLDEDRQPMWVNAIAKQDYAYEGDMVRFTNGNNSVRLTVTPDHSQYVERRVDRGSGGRQFVGQFLRADEAFQSPENHLYLSSENKGHPVSDIAIGEGVYPLEPLLRLLGYYLSEGSTRKRGNHYESVITQHKHLGVMQQGVTDCWVQNYVSGHKIYLQDQGLSKWLYQFGKSFEKFIPVFVSRCTPEQIRMFLEAYALGDGSVRTRESFGYSSTSTVIYTSSIRIRDQLVELAILANLAANYALVSPAGTETTHHNGTYTSNHDVWGVTIRTTRKQKPDTTVIPYRGRVYDVTLEEHHKLLVAEQGRVCWSGNCRGIVTLEVKNSGATLSALGGSAIQPGVALQSTAELTPDQLGARMFGEFDDVDGDLLDAVLGGGGALIFGDNEGDDQ